MKTTKVLFFSFLFLLGAATVSAQHGEKRDPTEMAERQSERLATVLDLTPEQTERVKAVNLAFAEKMAPTGKKSLKTVRPDARPCRPPTKAARPR